MTDKQDPFSELANLSLLDGHYTARQRKNPGQIKYGFIQDQTDPHYIIAVPSHMEALMFGRRYLQQGHCYRKVANWITARTGRKLDFKGLEVLFKKEQKLQRLRRQIAATSGALDDAL